MKKLLILILLFGGGLKAQITKDTIMLCDLVKKSYYVKYNAGLQTIWTVEPEIPIRPFGNSNVELTIEELGNYILTAQYTNGYCTSDPSRLLITVIPCIETTAYIPNAFTPNGDGINNSFGLIGENIYNYTMEIFDRWGNLLFISTDLNKQWLGPDVITDKDSFVYTYKITYQDVKKRHYEMYGRITLIK